MKFPVSARSSTIICPSFMATNVSFFLAQLCAELLNFFRNLPRCLQQRLRKNQSLCREVKQVSTAPPIAQSEGHHSKMFSLVVSSKNCSKTHAVLSHRRHSPHRTQCTNMQGCL